MTNGEKFKEIFSITQVEDCGLNVYAWLPNHDAVEIPPEWWNAEYKESKTGHCKDCKYFEYDSVAKVDGIPLIVAHEICSKWGNGCKTWEDGYCFMFEPQESEDAE